MIPTQHTPWWHRLLAALRRDPLLALLLLALPVLGALSPLPVASYPLLVDWPTIAALAGLLLLTQGVELSGGLQRAGHWLLGRVHTERGLALALVLASAALSTVLTNDVALFVVVPLTLGVARITAVPLVRLVVFEALAVNAGSALTPVGNPQNLFLWQQSHGGFAGFTLQMLPLVGLLMALLLALTACAFSGRKIAMIQSAPPALADQRLLWLALALYPPFLLLADLQRVLWALVGVALVMLWARPRVFALLDWGLLLVFVLMFIDLRLLAGLETVRALGTGVGLGDPQRLYWAGIAASQLLSNVPAAIALSEYSDNWRTVAWAVNIGGFGLVQGSLANLIALRLLGQGRAWLVFHYWSLPFLLVSAGLVYLLWY